MPYSDTIHALFTTNDIIHARSDTIYYTTHKQTGMEICT